MPGTAAIRDSGRGEGRRTRGIEWPRPKTMRARYSGFLFEAGPASKRGKATAQTATQTDAAAEKWVFAKRRVRRTAVHPPSQSLSNGQTRAGTRSGMQTLHVKKAQLKGYGLVPIGRQQCRWREGHATTNSTPEELICAYPASQSIDRHRSHISACKHHHACIFSDALVSRRTDDGLAGKHKHKELPFGSTTPSSCRPGPRDLTRLGGLGAVGGKIGQRLIHPTLKTT